MNISYIYRPTYLITFGITFIVLFNLTLIAIIPGFNIKYPISLLLLLIGIPIITSYGLYNIIQGTWQFEIQFSKVSFKVLKNSKLEIDEPVGKIKNINITHGEVSLLMYGIFEYFEIEIELIKMEKFQLFIRGKKWILKFIEFTKLLEEYCSEKQIEIIKLVKGQPL